MTTDDTSKGATETATVVIVGGGFAGVGCAQRLAKHDVRTILVDRNNYHQFQPLLYQVATDQLAPVDIARPLRDLPQGPDVAVKLGDVVAVDPDAGTVTTSEGVTYQGDYLVLAAGTRPNFFHTPGAEEHAFPADSLADAERLRSRILKVSQDADARSRTGRARRGQLRHHRRRGDRRGDGRGDRRPGERCDARRYHDLSVHTARAHVVDLGHVVLAPFTEGVHEYAAKVLARKGVQLHLGVSAKEIASGRALLSDGTRSAPERGARRRPAGEPAGRTPPEVPQGRGARVKSRPTHRRRPPLGRSARRHVRHPHADGGPLPQLGSVALQSGVWAVDNIVADIKGKPRKPFRYHDKGIMAMIGKNVAVAEVGAKHHELHGPVAFAAWLGVHAGS